MSNEKHPACLGYKKAIILLVPSFMGVIISNHYARISIKQTSILGDGFKYSLFSFYLGKMNPVWRAYFSDGLVQPPTRRSIKQIRFFFSWLLPGKKLQERDGSGATPLWLAAKGGPESTGASEQQSFLAARNGTQSDELQKYGNRTEFLLRWTTKKNGFEKRSCWCVLWKKLNYIILIYCT